MNKNDFPILKQKINGKRLVYLDNAATSQAPESVINSISEYYKTMHSNVHRSIHTLSEKATEEYENTRKKVAKFINADSEEIIFTKGTTESINLIAHGLKLKKDDEIVLTMMEHHANIVPWQQLGVKLKYIPITKDFKLDLEAAKKLITNKTKVVSVTHISNVLGIINPINELAKLAHKVGALIVVDAAQSVPHMKVDVKELNCDFLAFSAHKMLGPTGVGVLYGKKELLENLEPFVYGGKMIKEVDLDKTTFADSPDKFEGGTPNISGVIAFGKAIDYLNKIGMDKIEKHNKELIEYASKRIKEIKNVKVYGSEGSIISFNIEGMHSHDVSELLDREGVAIRGGHHCTMPLMKVLNIPGCSRASFYLYNTKEDVDIFIDALKKAIKVFKL